MPVFDFSNSPEKAKVSECTYTVFRTNAPFTSPDQPILILDTKEKAFPHHPCGIFTNPSNRTSFEFKNEEETFIADILQIDARFVSLLKWLGENHINVRLSGTQTSDGYAVYKIREIAFGGGAKLSAEDGFLQFMIERLLASNAPEEEVEDEDQEETGDSMKLTSIQSITDFMNCWKNAAGQYPPLGSSKPRCCPFPRSLSRRTSSRAARPLHDDEYSMEKQLF